jgi:phosphopantetheinyl transferase
LQSKISSLGYNVNLYRKSNGGIGCDNGYYVSVSHTINFSALAISNQPLGVDIESIKKTKLPLADTIFTLAEKERLMHTYEFATEYMKIFTAKEAYLKFKGIGILNPLSEIETTSKCNISQDIVPIKHYYVNGSLILAVCGQGLVSFRNQTKLKFNTI